MIANYIPGGIAILTGLFLASATAKGPDSMMEVLANGMGWYFVARGIYMITSLRAGRAFLQELAQSQHKEPSNETHKQCAACCLWVPKKAIKCGHCGTPQD